MAARFEVDIENGSFGSHARAFERDDLGVVFASDLMKTCGDDFSASHQHRTDHRIRTRPARSFKGKMTSHA